MQGTQASLNFLLGFQVINTELRRAIFHYGAGQMIRMLISRLRENGNRVTLYLIGAKYKNVPFRLEDEEIRHASILEFAPQKDGSFVWINEDWEPGIQPKVAKIVES